MVTHAAGVVSELSVELQTDANDSSVSVSPTASWPRDVFVVPFLDGGPSYLVDESQVLE